MYPLIKKSKSPGSKLSDSDSKEQITTSGAPAFYNPSNDSNQRPTLSSFSHHSSSFQSNSARNLPNAMYQSNRQLSPKSHASPSHSFESANQELQKSAKGSYNTESNSYLPPPALLSGSSSLIKSQHLPKPVATSLSVGQTDQSQPAPSTHRQTDQLGNRSSFSTYHRYPQSLSSPLSPIQTYPHGGGSSSIHGSLGVSPNEPTGHISYNTVHHYDTNNQPPPSCQAPQSHYQLPTPFSIPNSHLQQGASLPPIGVQNFLKHPEQSVQPLQPLQPLRPAQLAQPVVQSQNLLNPPIPSYQFQLQTSRVSEDLNARQGHFGTQHSYGPYASNYGGEVDRNQLQRKGKRNPTNYVWTTLENRELMSWTRDYLPQVWGKASVSHAHRIKRALYNDNPLITPENIRHKINNLKAKYRKIKGRWADDTEKHEVEIRNDFPDFFLIEEMILKYEEKGISHSNPTSSAPSPSPSRLFSTEPSESSNNLNLQSQTHETGFLAGRSSSGNITDKPNRVSSLVKGFEPQVQKNLKYPENDNSGLDVDPAYRDVTIVTASKKKYQNEERLPQGEDWSKSSEEELQKGNVTDGDSAAELSDWSFNSKHNKSKEQASNEDSPIETLRENKTSFDTKRLFEKKQHTSETGVPHIYNDTTTEANYNSSALLTAGYKGSSGPLDTRGEKRDDNNGNNDDRSYGFLKRRNSVSSSSSSSSSQSSNNISNIGTELVNNEISPGEAQKKDRNFEKERTVNTGSMPMLQSTQSKLQHQSHAQKRRNSEYSVLPLSDNNDFKFGGVGFGSRDKVELEYLKIERDRLRVKVTRLEYETERLKAELLAHSNVGNLSGSVINTSTSIQTNFSVSHGHDNEKKHPLNQRPQTKDEADDELEELQQRKKRRRKEDAILMNQYKRSEAECRLYEYKSRLAYLQLKEYERKLNLNKHLSESGGSSVSNNGALSNNSVGSPYSAHGIKKRREGEGKRRFRRTSSSSSVSSNGCEVEANTSLNSQSSDGNSDNKSNILSVTNNESSSNNRNIESHNLQEPAYGMEENKSKDEGVNTNNEEGTFARRGLDTAFIVQSEAKLGNETDKKELRDTVLEGAGSTNKSPNKQEGANEPEEEETKKTGGGLKGKADKDGEEGGSVEH